MIREILKNRWVRCALAFVLYFPAAKIGLRLAYLHPSASPVWLGTGITLTLFLLWGRDLWPGIFLGAFLVNITTAGNIYTSLAIAIGNTLEGMLGAHLVNAYAGGRMVFERPQTIVRYIFLAGCLSTMISSTVGAMSLAIAGYATWSDYGLIWFTWWLGDMGGALIIAPFLILWSSPYLKWWSASRLPEMGLMGLMILLVGVIVFTQAFPSVLHHYPLDFLCLPLVVLAAFRFGRRGATLTSMVFAAFAIWGTLHGFGPFVRKSPNVSLLLLQGFMIVASLTGLVLAALVLQQKRTEAAERERAQEALQASETRYRQLLESNIIGVMIVDWGGRVLDANETFLQMLGYTREDLEANRMGGDTLTPQEYRAADEWVRIKLRESGVCPPFEKEYFRKDGSRIPVLVGVVFHDTPEHRLVCLVIDATERRKALVALQKAYDEMETRVTQRTSELAVANRELTKEVERRRRAEAALQSLAITDPLTGLYNRRGFATLANQLILQARRAREPFMVFVADLDGLKTVNDSYGHHEGDQAVIAAATILKNTFRNSDVIARVGGDEFAVAVHEDIADSGEHAVLRRLQEQLDEFNKESRRKYTLSLSLGSAELKPRQRKSLDTLLAQADVELYKQKRAKKIFRLA